MCVGLTQPGKFWQGDIQAGALCHINAYWAQRWHRVFVHSEYGVPTRPVGRSRACFQTGEFCNFPVQEVFQAQFAVTVPKHQSGGISAR